MEYFWPKNAMLSKRGQGHQMNWYSLGNRGLYNFVHVYHFAIFFSNETLN